MRKIISLTENDIRRIVKQTLLEKMGVPDNITETGRSIYAEIMTRLFSMDPEEQNSVYRVNIDKDFNIADFHFNKVNFVISVHLSKMDPAMLPLISGFAASLPQRTGDKRIEHLHGVDVVRIQANIEATDKWTLHDIIKLMTKDESKTISSITHELKHAFDNEKRSGVPFSDESEYEAHQSVSFGPVSPINYFFHYLYFLHRTEDLTRSSQLYSQMMTKGITKSQFLKFYNESEMVDLLKNARDLTFDNFKASFYDYIPQINKVFDFSDKSSPDNPPMFRGDNDDETVDIFLDLVYRVAVGGRIRSYVKIVKQSMSPPDFATGMGIMMGLIQQPDTKDKEKLVNEYIKTAQKYKNYKDFFGNEIKIINFAANKTLRKLAKLYDMAKDDTKSSIVDWDSHHRINNTDQKTLEEMAKVAREMAAEKLQGKKSSKKR
jgi:hypothetical protein